MITLLGTAITMVILFVAYLAYEHGYRDIQRKKGGELVRIFLYENVSGKPVYMGERVAQEKTDEQIGSYLLIKKNKIPLKRISNNDFIQDKEYGKALHVVMFASDDYRPLVRLNGEEWYRKETRPEYEIVETTDEETGETVQVEQQVTDNKTGELITKEHEIKYDAPLGINQKDRDVMMFNLSYHRRMDQKYKETEGKFAKMLPYINVAVMGMILLMGFIYMTKSTNETQLEMTAVFDENAKAIIDETGNPSFIEGIANTIRNKNDEEKAPPT